MDASQNSMIILSQTHGLLAYHLNQIDNELCGIFEREDNQCSHNNIKSFKPIKTTTMFQIDKDLNRVYKRFRSFIEEAINANGGSTELA